MLHRIVRIVGWLAGGIALLGLAAWIVFRITADPPAEEILAAIEVPEAPVLSPAEEQATFRLAPGFRAELVAAEPLVVDPVAIDWDVDGRLYVVEMRGYMPDIDGNGEDLPIGRIVVLEDEDGDGQMDTSTVFLDGLVMPRAVRVLPQGVLVGTPGDLWLCRDPASEGRCTERVRLHDYASVGTNPEHQENALLPGIDGWLYNAKSSRRMRLSQDGTQLDTEKTPPRGQWGLAQDDEGRLYYNHNSAFLYVDAIPGAYPMRQPALAAAHHKEGIAVPLSTDEEVHSPAVQPGLNRAYLAGTLRADGTQRGPTGVSGLTIQRGGQFGADFSGDAFVPESAGNAISHFSIETDGNEIRAEHRVYPAPDGGDEQEFLVSDHERFRPVDAEIGPDGALWVIDMYRGLVQHAEMVSDHLRAFATEHDLIEPGATGRIWRIVREDRPIAYRPPPLDTLAARLAGLEHENGWVRERAQRLLAHAPDASTRAALHAFAERNTHGRIHSLWALSAAGVLDVDDLRRGLGDPDPRVRRTALRAAEPFLNDPDAGSFGLIEGMLEDSDASVRLQTLHTLGALPAQSRPLSTLLDAGRDGDALTRQAVRSSLAGLEVEALEQEFAFAAGRARADEETEWLVQLAESAHAAARAGNEREAATLALLDRVDTLTADEDRTALLQGIARGQSLPRMARVELAERHEIFSEEREDPAGVRDAIAAIRYQFTWPGDPRPGGARPLTAQENLRFTEGAQLYADACAQCHGSDGRGIEGQAPPLALSPWVRDSDAWLVRIVLQGLTGRIVVNGETWNLNMPPHDDAEVFDDLRVAAILTFLRRSFGHVDEPVSPATVAAIRAATAERRQPWTAEELLALEDIDHRFAPYAGLWEVPFIGMQLEVGREGTALRIGVPNGPGGAASELRERLFMMGDVATVEFEAATGDEPVREASLVYEGMTLPLTRVED